MSKARLLHRPKSVERGPTTAMDWNMLMRKVLRRAEELRDPRLESLRLSLSKGESERRLRKMGIIREADIQREFKRQ